LGVQLSRALVRDEPRELDHVSEPSSGDLVDDPRMLRAASADYVPKAQPAATSEVDPREGAEDVLARLEATKREDQRNARWRRPRQGLERGPVPRHDRPTWQVRDPRL